MSKRKVIAALLCMVFLVATVVGCGGDSADKKTAKILYVEWACATATSHVVAEVLESKLGYDVELVPVTAAAMYEGLAGGSGDATFCSWLPVTHKEYMDKMGDRVENLGVNMEGAKLGLTVPEYVTINSIDELNGVKDRFDGKIIGIDPGAGIMGLTEQAIEDYQLDYELVEGSDSTMTAALKKAIDNQDWVVVTGWTPHWKFARWDLKFLEDPKLSLGEEEQLNTVVRRGLKEDMPDAYEFFDKFRWTSDDLANAIVMAEDMGDSEEAAAKWVEENEELVNSWLPKD
ncbi:MAG: glycine betaine ABC transporter substrate-binding protein [Syntrophomonadales bacterium]